MPDDTTQELTQMLQDWIEVFMRRAMHNVLLFAKEHNFSMSQISALLNIRQRRVCNVSNIGDELSITSAAASQMLEQLVQQGVIERTESPHDRRVKQIALTEKGHQMIHDGFRARYAWLGELAASFTPSEQEQVSAALRLLLERTRRLDVPDRG
ncbi:MAG TPA: MarR family transcriptional regulator [Anaerolineae bacterium]|nr:MarR family transcriptional regulator [Anaerolineae bacterium]HQH37331.1 MarR family transcriptional regulator [Anaerolineae bacterium]